MGQEHKKSPNARAWATLIIGCMMQRATKSLRDEMLDLRFETTLILTLSTVVPETTVSVSKSAGSETVIPETAAPGTVTSLVLQFAAARSGSRTILKSTGTESASTVIPEAVVPVSGSDASATVDL